MKAPQTILKPRFANPKLAAIAESFQVRPGHSLGYYLFMELLAFLSLVLGVILLFPLIVFIFSLPGAFLAILFQAMGIKIDTLVLIMAGLSALSSYYISYSLITKYFFKVRAHAKRARVNALSALSKRSEDPVLYLRSFADDARVNPTSRSQKTYEEDLALALNVIGPVIAIGEPLESDTHLGATRIYLKNDDWKANVRRLMQISQLVVIQPGTSGGVIWELEAALETIDPRKVIMSFLAWQHLDNHARQVEHQLFRQRVADFMYRSPSPVTINLPEKIGNAPFLVFSDNWVPELVKSREVKWLYRFSSSLFVTEAIRPALRERNLRLSWWRNVPYLVFVSWLLFGVAWTFHWFPNIFDAPLYFFKTDDPRLLFWFNLAAFAACLIVLAWVIGNLFLFIYRAPGKLLRLLNGGARRTT
jgi:hypothetical protein